MGGKIYRALARNQYLQPVVDLFQSIQDQKRKEQWLKDVQGVRAKFGNDYSQITNATQPQTTQETNPNYTPYSVQKPAIPNFNILQPNAGVTPTVPSQNTEMVTRPTFDKTTNVPLSDFEKYNQARDLGNKTIWDLLTNPDTQKYGDNNVLNQMIGDVRQGVEQFRPSFKYGEYDPTKTRYRINERTGQQEILDQGQPNAKLGLPTEITATEDDPKGQYKKGDAIRIAMDESVYPPRQIILGKVSTKMTPYQEGMLANANKRENREAAKTNEDKKAGKGLTPNTAGPLAQLQHPELFKNVLNPQTGNTLLVKYDSNGQPLKDDKGNYVEDPVNGKPVPNSPETQAYLRDKAFNDLQLQTLTPRAYEFSKNLEKSFGRKLTAAELGQEALKHAKDKRISDEDAGAIAKYLKYVSQFDTK